MLNKLYHKIETLWKFDSEKKEFIHGVYRNKDVEALKDYKWIFTEKVDGTNFRIIWDGYSVSFGGRTEKSEFSKKQLNFIEEHFLTKDFEYAVEQVFGDKEVIIYGELFGNDIQGVGKLYSESYEFMIFDIKINNLFLTHDDIEDISKKLNCKHVPIIFVGTIKEALEFFRRECRSTFSSAPLEGLVGVPYGNFLDRRGKRIIIKIKARDIK